MNAIPLLSFLGIVTTLLAQRRLRPKRPAVRGALGGCGIVLCLLLPSFCHGQTEADAELTAAIAQIRAFDNHAHPLRVTAEGEEDFDSDGLAAAQTPFPEFPLPVGLRPPKIVAARQALYGNLPGAAKSATLPELMEAKRRVQREQGDAYPAWVLDQLGIQTMIANRVRMGRGLDAPRFRWAPFVDFLLFPFTNQVGRAKNPEYRLYYTGMEQLLTRTLKQRQLSTLPETLDQYAAKAVTPTLEEHRRGGAIAVKFEATYLRSLAFDDASGDEARRVYAQQVEGRAASPAKYKTLQDYLFRFIARAAGRLGMAVHIHVGAGAGAFFDLAGSNPILLEPTLNDPSLRDTRFVLIHGGWPFHGETAFLLAKPHVYADFSAMTFLLSARSLAGVLRTWIEWYPEKILFGTDGFTFSPEVGWEEISWLSNRTGRDALALALTGLMNDREITRERALELARLVMRENALRLYKLESPAGTPTSSAR